MNKETEPLYDIALSHEELHALRCIITVFHRETGDMLESDIANTTPQAYYAMIEHAYRQCIPVHKKVIEAMKDACGEDFYPPGYEAPDSESPHE